MPKINEYLRSESKNGAQQETDIKTLKKNVADIQENINSLADTLDVLMTEVIPND